MKTFRFNLQKILEWREMQVRAAEEKLSQLLQLSASLEQQVLHVQMGYDTSEAQTLTSPLMSGMEMQALAAFKVGTNKQLQRIRARQDECKSLISDQRGRMLRAKRDCRVLEKLRERRLQSWVYLHDQEVETTAAEVYLANWPQSEAESHTNGGNK